MVRRLGEFRRENRRRENCARARTGGGVGVRGARVLVDKLGGVRVVERAGGAPRRDGALLLQLVGEGDGAAHLRPRDRVHRHAAAGRPALRHRPAAGAAPRRVRRQPEVDRLDEVRRRRRPVAAERVEEAEVVVRLLRRRRALAAVRERVLERVHRLLDLEVEHQRPAELRPRGRLVREGDGGAVRLDRRLHAALRLVQRRQVDVRVVGRRRGGRRAQRVAVVLLGGRPLAEVVHRPAQVVVDHVPLEGGRRRRERERAPVVHDRLLPVAVLLQIVGDVERLRRLRGPTRVRDHGWRHRRRAFAHRVDEERRSASRWRRS